MNHFGYTSGSGREGRQPEVKVGRSAHNAMTLWWVPLRKGVLIQLYNVVVVQILSVIGVISSHVTRTLHGVD